MEFLHWLENSAFAVHIRQSAWLYPILEIIHIIGIVLLAGAAFMFDLRLLGCANNLPVAPLATHLLSWSQRGLYLIIPSGVLLFITDATKFGTDPTFWIKMSLLILAGLNVTIFRQGIFKSGEMTDTFSARVVAVLSITLWLAIITCGRLLAY